MTATRLRPAHRPVTITARLAELGYVEVPRLTLRRQLTQLLRPSRSRQADRLLARYRWANAGLRERLREAEVRHDQTLDELTALVDDQARSIGHAHPAIVGVRAIVGEARVR